MLTNGTEYGMIMMLLIATHKNKYNKGDNNMISVDKITTKLYACPICGEIYETPQEVAKCTTACAKKAEEDEKAEKLREMNEALEEIKRITQVRQNMLDDFKKKYPEAYERNFGSSEDKVNWNNTRTYVNKDTKEPVNKDDAGVKEFIDFLSLLAGR